jgi:hypothetical protein
MTLPAGGPPAGGPPPPPPKNWKSSIDPKVAAEEAAAKEEAAADLRKAAKSAEKPKDAHTLALEAACAQRQAREAVAAAKAFAAAVAAGVDPVESATASAAAKKHLEGCMSALRKNSGAVDPDAVVEEQEWAEETPEQEAARLVKEVAAAEKHEAARENIRKIDEANKAAKLAKNEAVRLALLDPVEAELLQFMKDNGQSDRDAARKMLIQRKKSEGAS